MRSVFSVWHGIEFLTIFFSIWIILSVWAGYLGILFPGWVIIAFVLTFLVHSELKPATSIPHTGLMVAVGGMCVLILGAIFFGIQGGYDLSADVAPSLATHLIATHIPSSYLPYYDVPLFYQMGLPSIASQLSWTGIPTHVVLWGFAVVGTGLLLAGLMRVGHQINSNPLFLFWIPILFLGTRLPFYNVWVGEYPWMVAAGLGMMGVALMSRSWRIGAVVLAATTLVHPYIGILSALLWVVIQKPSILLMGKTVLVMGTASIPILLYQIIPFMGLPKQSLSGVIFLSWEHLIGNVFVVGIVPVLIGLGALAHWVGKSRVITHPDVLLFYLGFGGILAGYLFGVFWHNSVFGPKLLMMGMIGILFLGAQWLSHHVRAQHVGLGAVIILVASGFILADSSGVQHWVEGSKATLEEAKFATQLYTFDPRVVPVLFLSDGGGKMAQYSNKISLDPDNAHPLLVYQLLNTPSANVLHQQTMDYLTLKENRCTECVPSFLEKYPAKYVVVNTAQYAPLSNYLAIFRSGPFIVYEGNAEKNGS